MLDGTVDNRLLEMVCHLIPRTMGLGVGYWIRASLGEGLEGCLSERTVIQTKLAQLQPELSLPHWGKSVKWQIGWNTTETTD